jgi:hypothetical protein
MNVMILCKHYGIPQCMYTLNVPPYSLHWHVDGFVNPETGDNPIRRKCGTEGKHQPTFCVNVRPWPHLDTHTCGPSFWTWRILWNWA